MCNGSIAVLNGFDNQHTAQALTRGTVVAAAAGVSYRSNPHAARVDIIIKASLPKEHTRLLGATGNPPGPRIILLVPTGWCWWRMHSTIQHQQAAAPRISVHNLLPSYSCLSAPPVSHNALSFVRQSITNGWRLASPLVRGCFSPESHATARQRLVYARSVRQADAVAVARQCQHQYDDNCSQ